MRLSKFVPVNEVEDMYFYGHCQTTTVQPAGSLGIIYLVNQFLG